MKKAGAKWVSSQESSYVAFGGGKSGASHRDMYELKLSGVKVSMICAPLQPPRLSAAVLDLFGHLDLADRYDSDRQVSVDILIGLDLFWTLMVPGKVQSAGGLVAQLSVFG